MLDYKPSLVKGFIDKEEFARAVHLGLFAATGPEFREVLRLGQMWSPYFTEEWKVNGRPGPQDFISGRAPRLPERDVDGAEFPDQPGDRL